MTLNAGFGATRHIALIAVLSVLGCAMLSGCSNIPDTVKTGAAFALAGKRAERGQDLRNGFKLAVADHNAEGFRLKGKPVTLELVAGDDKADAATGKAVAQQSVDAGVGLSQSRRDCQTSLNATEPVNLPLMMVAA